MLSYEKYIFENSSNEGSGTYEIIIKVPSGTVVVTLRLQKRSKP